MLCTSTLTQKGQATIPAEIRKKLNLHAGDKIGFEIKKEIVSLKKIKPFDYAYHQALKSTLSEWDSMEDNEAYHGL